MFDKLKKMVFEEEKPQIPVAAPVVAPGPVLGTTAFMPSMITNGTPQVSTELLADLFNNINKAVTPNHLLSLMEMSETMKSAIADEGVRIKAASAALKLTFADVEMSINALVSALENEKKTFMSTHVAGLEADIQKDTTTLASINADIESTIAKLNQLTADRDALGAIITQKQNDKTVTVAVFEATVTKINTDLEGERNKTRVYVPVGVIA